MIGISKKKSFRDPLTVLLIATKSQVSGIYSSYLFPHPKAWITINKSLALMLSGYRPDQSQFPKSSRKEGGKEGKEGGRKVREGGRKGMGKN